MQTNGSLRQLFNGNIAASSLNIPQLAATYWIDRIYTYDQLNRIKSATAYHTTGIGATPVHNGDYDEQFTFDGNGNMLTVNRNGSGTGTLKDIVTYNYNRDANSRLLNNKLNYLNGHAQASNITPDQALNNYTYDQIGNLTADVQAGITGITWNVYGKILTISKASGNITYTYNPAGERVSKTAAGLTTWYVRDAQGNTLAVYDNKSTAVNWREQHLYGSSRLGMWTPNINIAPGTGLAVWDTVGRKQYELTNHLGNVLATITDKRLQHTTNGTTVDYYNTDIATAQDYYAFGSLMPARQYNLVANNYYRYGFNGKENDNDVGKGVGNEQDYGARIYDGRIGRFLSVDPIGKNYPELTSYQFASNNPIQFIDLDGFEKAKPEHSGDPITDFFNDIVFKLEQKEQKFEARVSKMSDQEITNAINRTVANAIRNPDKLVQDGAKDLNKQINQVPVDVQTLAHLVKSGQNDKAKNFAENMVIVYGPWFFAPEEKEYEATAPALFGYKSTFKGGAKGSLLTGKVEGKAILEGNHLPTVNSMKQAGVEIAYKEASAIQMLFDDHRIFESTGNGAKAVAFRAHEALLLKQGKYLEAFDYNAARIHAAYGNKYDEALKEAREYYKEHILPRMEKNNIKNNQ